MTLRSCTSCRLRAVPRQEEDATSLRAADTNLWWIGFPSQRRCSAATPARRVYGRASWHSAGRGPADPLRMRLANNACFDNHHFGLAVRDDGSYPDLKQNICHHNMLSGILLFHGAKALLLGNTCEHNYHWGLVMTPDSYTSPEQEQLLQANALTNNPRGPLIVTQEPLGEIGR